MERTLGETLPRIRRYLRESGGMPPTPRRRRVGHLSLDEREEISRGIAAGLSARAIAGGINRPSSTLSREISRNGGRDGYRALVADAAAFERARRPKSSKLAANPELRDVVADKLDDDWSPQPIAQWLRREYLDDAAMQISHESIYRDLYLPSRKVFDASLFHRLRRRRRVGQGSPDGRRTGVGTCIICRPGPVSAHRHDPKARISATLPALHSRKSHQSTDQKKPRPVGESPDTGSVSDVDDSSS